MNRAAAISLAALLSVGGATTALVSIAGADATDPSTTTTTEAPAPAVTDFSSTLAGLGDISLTFDPITHEISNIVVTPLDGITAALPVAVHNGIQLVFTMADGTVKTIVVEVEGDHGTVTIEVEDPESEDDEQQSDGHRSDGPPPIEDRGVSADHRNDNHDRHGPDVTTPPTTTSTNTITPPVTSATDQSGSSNREDSESESDHNSDSDSDSDSED